MTRWQTTSWPTSSRSPRSTSRRPTPLAASAGPKAALARRLGALVAPFAGRVPLPILDPGLGVALSIALLTVALAAVAGRGTVGVEARESSADVVHATAVEEHAVVPPRATPRPIPTASVVRPRSPTPLWEPRDAGWLALGAPVLQPAHRLPAERLRLLDGAERSRTIEVQFSVLLKSGSSAPVWGVLLAYQSELERTRLQFFADDYDGGRPYVALYTARDGKDVPVVKPQRVLDYDFWGRDTHRLTVQIGDQQVRAVLDGRVLGRWPNPGIVAAPKGLYVLGPSRMQSTRSWPHPASPRPDYS